MLERVVLAAAALLLFAVIGSAQEPGAVTRSELHLDDLALDGVQVQTTLHHPTLGLVVGTMGQGLWIQSPDGEWQHIEATLPGSTDSLPGNYIHALDIASNGDLLLACSWGGLDRRFQAHTNARTRGLITDEDPHDFLRASLVRYDGNRWSVRYLFQNYRKADRCELAGIHASLRDDIDGDGNEELVIQVDVMRQLHGKGWMSLDLGTLEMDWFVPAPAPQLPVVLMSKDGRKKLIAYSAPTDQGAVVGDQDDTQALLYVIDGNGTVDQVIEIPGHLAQEPLRIDGPSPGILRDTDRVLLVFDSKGSRSPRTLCWSLDLRNFALEPADSLVLGNVPRVGHSGTAIVASRVSASEAQLPEFYDPRTGRVLATLAADRLAPLYSTRGWTYGSAQTPEGGLSAAILGENGYAFWAGAEPEVELLQELRPADRLYWSVPDWRGRFWILGWNEPDAELSIWSAPQRLQNGLSQFTVPIWIPQIARDSKLRFRGPLKQPDWHWPAIMHHLAIVERQDGSDQEWIQIDATSKRLRVLDSHGAMVDEIPLPAGIQDETGFAWLNSVPPVVEGRAMPGLVTTGCPPWKLHLLDREQNRWRGPIVLDLPFLDLHANAITAIADDGRVVGTESGVRFLDRKGGGVERWPTDSNERVRGLRKIDASRVLAWGDFGERLVYLPSSALLDGVYDFIVKADTLWTLLPVGLARRAGDGEFEPVSTWKNPQRNLPPESRFIEGPKGVWYQPFDARNGAGFPPTVIGRWQHPWRHGFSPFYVEGNERVVRRILDVGSDRWIAATDWGLILIAEPRGQFRAENLIENNTICHDVAPADGEHLYAAIADGRILRLSRDDPAAFGIDARSRAARDAVLEFDANGPYLWARTATGIERWDPADRKGDRSWGLPDSVRTLAFGVYDADDVWLGTDRGVWRLNGLGSALVPVVLPEIGNAPVQRVALRSEGSTTHLVVLAEGKLFDFRLPGAGNAQALVESSGDTVEISTFDDGPDLNSGVVALELDGAHRGLRAGKVDPMGVARYSLPELPRGRHRLRLIAYDRWGHALQPDFERTLVFRESGATASALAILVPIPLLAIWAFDPRRAWRFGAMGVLVALLVPLSLEFLFLYAVPWSSGAGICAALLLGGVITRSRQSRLRLSRQEAIERLRFLLSAFRHRGLGGFSPLDRLLHLARNMDEAVLVGQDIETETRTIVQELQEATQPLSEEIDQLVAGMRLGSPLVKRFRGLLEELRASTAELLVDDEAMRAWISDANAQLAIDETGTAFDRALNALAENLARYRAAPIGELLREFAQRPRTDVEIDLVSPEPDGGPQIPAAELLEVLENLERNAVRAMADSGVEEPRIRIGAEKKGGLFFEDNGPGIAAEMLDRIFEQGHSTTGGSGTGLHRSRELVEGWGASIRAVAPGELGGAQFVIEFEQPRRRSVSLHPLVDRDTADAE